MMSLDHLSVIWYYSLELRRPYVGFVLPVILRYINITSDGFLCDCTGHTKLVTLRMNRVNNTVIFYFLFFCGWNNWPAEWLLLIKTFVLVGRWGCLLNES